MSDEIEPEVSEDMSLSAEPQEAAPEAPPEAPPETSPWDSFRSLPEYQGLGDQEIAASLYQAKQREEAASRALRQYQQIMPVAQEYLTNRPDFEKWREAQRQQQQQPQQQQEQKPGWWNPPEVRDAYKKYLVKDEQGRDAIHPDAPMDARAALTEWMDYRANFAQKFLTNPEDAIGPMVQELAQQKAQELIEQTLERRDNEGFVKQVEEENRDWLFDQETGNVSVAGLLVHKYIEQAKQHGINGPKARWDYAVAMTEREMLAQQFDAMQQQPQSEQPVQQQPPQPAPQQSQPDPELAQKNMEYLRREASRNPSRSAGAANSDPRQSRPKRSFEEMLVDEASTRGFL